MDKLEVNDNGSSEEKAVESDNTKDEGGIHDNKKSHVLKKRKENSRLGEAGFLASLGGAVKKYWKIGVHWLEALRDLLACPFDARAWLILQKSI